MYCNWLAVLRQAHRTAISAHFLYIGLHPDPLSSVDKRDAQGIAYSWLSVLPFSGPAVHSGTKAIDTAQDFGKSGIGMEHALHLYERWGILVYSLQPDIQKEPMQQKLKVVLSDFLDRTGFVSLLRRSAAARGGMVLALHRVLPQAERSSCYDPHLALSESAFVSLLRLLKKDYRVVPLPELLKDPRSADGRPKVALTFDDGWEDNYRVAFPHLLAHQMPATIFACTDLLDTNAVLPEERFARLWAMCTSSSRLKELLADLNHWGMGKHTNTYLKSQRKYWSRELKRMPLNARLLLLDHLENRYEVSPVTTRRFMTWADVRVMVGTGLIQMGSHTSRHATLTSETDRDVRRELEVSRAALQEHTGMLPEILAYPNGMYNRRVAELARLTGFKAALSTAPGMTNRRSNPFAIPRIAVDDTTVTDANVQLSPSRTSVYFLSSRLRSAS